MICLNSTLWLIPWVTDLVVSNIPPRLSQERTNKRNQIVSRRTEMPCGSRWSMPASHPKLYFRFDFKDHVLLFPTGRALHLGLPLIWYTWGGFSCSTLTTLPLLITRWSEGEAWGEATQSSSDIWAHTCFRLSTTGMDRSQLRLSSSSWQYLKQ